MKAIHTIYIALFAAATAQAQDSLHNHAHETTHLHEVVVSANRQETMRKYAPATVGVIKPTLMQQTMSNNLAQGLNFSPGVRTENACGNCGFTQVRLNGLGGHYSQILIDSRPVISSLASVYGLEQLPIDMIERIEIVRGGTSALYGASAIGGTVNVITRKPTRNEALAGHTLSALGGSAAFDNTTNIQASVLTDDKRAGVYFYAQNRSRAGYDHNDDGYTDLPELRNTVVGLNGLLHTGDHSTLSFTYRHDTDYQRGGNNLELPQHESNISEGASHKIDGGALNFDFSTPDHRHRVNLYAASTATRRDSYYGGIGEGTPDDIEASLKAYATTRDLLAAAGAQYTYCIPKLFFMPADLTVGSEYSYNRLTDHSIGYDLWTKQTARVAGVYLQNEWKSEQWTILAGARLDHHNLVGRAIVSPRFNVRYAPVDKLTLRVGYGEGYRAPQTYDEDLHVGVSGGERIRVRSADGLHEERSNSFTATAEWEAVEKNDLRLTFSLDGFYTKLRNVFAYRMLDEYDEAGCQIQERYNGSGATVYGASLEATLAYRTLLSLSAGATLQRSRYDEAEEWSETAAAEKEIFKSPNMYGYFVAALTPSDRWEFSANGTFTGKQFVPHYESSGTDHDVAVRTDAFLELGVQAAYRIPLNGYALRLKGGVQNITNAFQKDRDKGYGRDSQYLYGPLAPRTVYLGIALEL